MSLENARSFFMWCTIINYALLLLWSMLYMLWRDGFYRWWRMFAPISREQYEMLNIGGISLYKIGVILFNLVPWIALSIVR